MDRRPVDFSRCSFALCLASLLLASCSQYQPFDSVAALRDSYADRAGGRAAQIEVPFELDDQLKGVLDDLYKPSPKERRRAQQLLDFIFGSLDLQYSLNPTRNAVETYHAREGNCLSFVNLFIGAARHQRLAPFYVEVTDYQRWNYRDGLVVSRGHIVAGLYLEGELVTYDFLPYRAKAYKSFKPIDDQTAAAHYYNNLGAEALMRGNVTQAHDHVQTALVIDPTFVKGMNNLGVVQARRGELDEAVATYQSGLQVEPENVALLTNLARAHQQSGRTAEALAVLERVDVTNNTNPFFFVYKGELALAEGDLEGAVDYMRQALRRDSELPEVHLGLVKVYLVTGDMRKVRHHLGRALRLDATHPEALKYAALLQDSSSTAPAQDEG